MTRFYKKYIIQENFNNSAFWTDRGAAGFTNLKNARNCLRQMRKDPFISELKKFRIKKVTEEILDE